MTHVVLLVGLGIGFMDDVFVFCGCGLDLRPARTGDVWSEEFIGRITCQQKGIAVQDPQTTRHNDDEVNERLGSDSGG